jgi:hypothetical protein
MLFRFAESQGPVEGPVHTRVGTRANLATTRGLHVGESSVKAHCGAYVGTAARELERGESAEAMTDDRNAARIHVGHAGKPRERRRRPLAEPCGRRPRSRTSRKWPAARRPLIGPPVPRHLPITVRPGAVRTGTKELATSSRPSRTFTPRTLTADLAPCSTRRQHVLVLQVGLEVRHVIRRGRALDDDELGDQGQRARPGAVGRATWTSARRCAVSRSKC